MITSSGSSGGKSPYKYLLLTIVLILIDQGIKLWMYFDVLPNHYGEIDLIPGFFKLHYVENPGMAFGWELAGEYGKLLLTVFRLFAMVGICWYLIYLARKKAHNGLLWSIAAVLGGAIGNVIDSTFYGVWLKNSPLDASTPWFHGKVIDMFYAYGLDGNYPDWIPFLGGQYNTTPIFNFADACIFCGVVSILIFQKSFFIHEERPTKSIVDNEEVLTEEQKMLGDENTSFNEDEAPPVNTTKEDIQTVVNHKTENDSEQLKEESK
ncbi:lipoprotein signal peptidase [Emticicia sp. C21]|uniref:lipoprotein signal peptidase n=1 Tax=Emticicia sp. C21 TaxID=2302915 RepID=UPI000E35664D|nr:lipoprotein signal peptidase [Emticicia sp. C21]RFS14629.1 lipoprotein signal peptidase [Emticicia sp. C21]